MPDSPPPDRAEPGSGAGASARATSFGPAAASYQRGRPDYPPQALDWLLPPFSRKVLDLGAGTGKLTGQLCARGLQVEAVEPLEGMRAELRRSVPAAVPLAGAAERIPLPDASVDAVLMAQAWHWVEPAAASREVARVLVPGGVLGLLWNVPDQAHDWVAAFHRLMPPHEDFYQYSNSPVVSAPFGPVERRDIAWTYPMDRAALLDLVRSRSYVIRLPEPDRAALLTRVSRFADSHPELTGRDAFSFPLVTRCFRASVR